MKKNLLLLKDLLDLLKLKSTNAVSENVYIDKLDDIVSKHNNMYHRTIKMNPLDVKDNAYIDFSKEVNGKSKFKVSDHVRV